MSKKDNAKTSIQEIQLVIFKIGSEEFGADIRSVLEISRMLEITHIPEAPGFIQGVINLRGQVIAVVDIARQFDLTRRKDTEKTERIVIVEVEEETVGLIVDEVPEVLRVPETNIEPTPEIIQTKIARGYLQGVAKLDKRLIILLDLNKILSPNEVKEAGKITQSNTIE